MNKYNVYTMRGADIVITAHGYKINNEMSCAEFIDLGGNIIARFWLINIIGIEVIERVDAYEDKT